MRLDFGLQIESQILDFHGLITFDVASFSTWQPLKNRVSKTLFINQKNLKKFEVSSVASPHQIISDQRERERVRSDQRETAAWVTLAWVTRP